MEEERIERGRKELIQVSSRHNIYHFVVSTHPTLPPHPHPPHPHPPHTTHLVNHSVLPCVPALTVHDTTVKVPLHGRDISYILARRHISYILARRHISYIFSEDKTYPTLLTAL